MSSGHQEDEARQATSPAHRTDGGQEPGPTLHLVSVSCAPRFVDLCAPPVLFGRGADCDVQLASSEASRHHALIRRVGPIYVLRDLDSMNGTFVNGRRVSETPLPPRCVVRMGDWVAVAMDCAPGQRCDHGFAAQASELWGGSVLRAALLSARAAAASNLPIVLEGETGTGKELVARAIHQWSGRSGPFVAINCAALPDTLAEAELFGHRRGAFTGAGRASVGYFRAAHGGTLLLDEICDLPLTLQVKLLRVLEQREVVPLGEATPIPIDVRVIAAAQEPLRTAVDQRRFRADVYARLEGLTVRLPPLRERIEDVPHLWSKFIAEKRATDAPSLSTNALETLCLYDWPFNVRELRQLAHRLALLPPEQRMIHRRDLPARLCQAAARADGSARAHGASEPPASELQRFLAALRAHAGNVSRAARALGISRNRAYRLMNANPDVDVDAFRRGHEAPES